MSRFMPALPSQRLAIAMSPAVQRILRYIVFDSPLSFITLVSLYSLLDIRLQRSKQTECSFKITFIITAGNVIRHDLF